MKVAALLHAYPPPHGAGGEWHAHTLLRHLAGRGHQVRVVLTQPAVWQGSSSWDLDGVTVDAMASKAAVANATSDADVLVTHLESTPRAHAVAEVRGIPCVDMLHNGFTATRGWLSRGRVDLAVANSRWLAAEYADAPVPVAVMRPWTPVADYATTPGDRVTLVNLAKGGDVLWRLAKAMPRTRFLAVEGGYGPQTLPRPAPVNLEVVANTPNVRDDVLARTRILLMPSGYESWGRIGVEAMCAGIPVIAAPTPGLSESLGDAGTFVDRADTDGWVAAIRRLTGKTWTAASKAAKARAVELDKVAAADHNQAADRIESLVGERVHV